MQQDESTSKVCPKCEIRKPYSEFYRARGKRTRRDGLQTYCKLCATENAATWRRNNLDRQRQWQRENRAANPEHFQRLDRARYERSPAVQLVKAAKDHPCVDCGVWLPVQVMELDHVRGTKSFGLGGPRLREKPADAVREEIAKCEVRCPNCHRMRHYHEREQRKAAA